MQQLNARSIIGDDFEYKVIFNEFEENEIKKYKTWIYSRFGSICKKSMNTQLNSEWIARHYLSSKMILSASIMLTSLGHAIDKNVKICEPYLSYYSILTCCRALIFTLPDVSWNDGELLNMNHAKIGKLVKNCIMKLSKESGHKIYNEINSYKKYRELFSYKFPASDIIGTQLNGYSYDKTIEICKLYIFH